MSSSVENNSSLIASNNDSNNDAKNIFPEGKWEGRRVFKWNSGWTVLAIAAVAFLAIGAYQYHTQDLFEYLEDQANRGYFGGITQRQMESYYGHAKRSLTANEGRELYKKINTANLEFSKKALENNGSPDKIAYNACKTRHAARLFVRELTPEAYQIDAEYRDNILYGSKTGLSPDQIWDKYEGNCEKIISASGQTNSDVNFFVRFIPESLYSSMPQSARHAFIAQTSRR